MSLVNSVAWLNQGSFGLVHTHRGKVTVKLFKISDQEQYEYAYENIMHCIMLQRHQITVTEIKQIPPTMSMNGTLTKAPETISKVTSSLYVHRIGNEVVYFNLMTSAEMAESKQTQRVSIRKPL